MLKRILAISALAIGVAACDQGGEEQAQEPTPPAQQQEPAQPPPAQQGQTPPPAEPATPPSGGQSGQQ